MRTLFKQVLVVVVFFFFLASAQPLQAATLYWVGSDGANGSVASNWKTTDPGSCGGGDAGAAPTSADTIVFDADCDNGATLDSSFTATVDTVTINSGYTGTISQGLDLAVTNNFTQGGGTYTAGANNLDINGSFSFTSGSFTAPSSLMTIYDDFSASAGVTFDANGGTIRFDSDGQNSVSAQNVVITCNSISFNKVELHNHGTDTTGGSAVINSGCTLPLGADPTLGAYDEQFGTWLIYGVLSGTGTATVESKWPDNGNFRCVNNNCLSGFSRVNISPTFDIYSNITFDASAIDSIYHYGSVQGWNSTATYSAPADIYFYAGFRGWGANYVHNGGTAHLKGYYDTTETVQTDYGGYYACEGWDFNLVKIEAHDPDFWLNAYANSEGSCSMPLGPNPSTTGQVYLDDSVFSGSGTWTHTGYLALRQTSLVPSGANDLSNFDALSVSSDLLIRSYNGGTEPFNFSTIQELTIGGDFTATGFSDTYPVTFTAPPQLNLAGDLLFNEYSSFTQSSGEVHLTGTNQTLGKNAGLATYNFESLRKSVTSSDTLNFMFNTTFNIAGNMILSGGSQTSLLTLRSTVAGLEWYINPTGSRVANFLDVKDSNNTSSTNIAADKSTDSGNNTNWFFLPDTSQAGYIELVSPDNHAYVSSERPEVAWKPPNTSTTIYNLASSYKVTVSNAAGQRYVVDGIPANPPDSVSPYDATTYRATYQNWFDGDLLDNLLKVQTKTSTNWSSEMNDGKLDDGKYDWYVELRLTNGNSYGFSRSFFVDTKQPTLSGLTLNGQQVSGQTFTSESSTLTIAGTEIDSLNGSDQVASGPRSIEYQLYSVDANGVEVFVTSKVQDLSDIYWQDSGDKITDHTQNTSAKVASFTFTDLPSLSNGSYKLLLKAKDRAGNEHVSEYALTISSGTGVGGPSPLPTPSTSPSPTVVPSPTPTASPVVVLPSASPSFVPRPSPSPSPSPVTLSPSPPSEPPIQELVSNPGIPQATIVSRQEVLGAAVLTRIKQIAQATTTESGAGMAVTLTAGLAVSLAGVGVSLGSVGGTMPGLSVVGRASNGLKTFGILPIGKRAGYLLTSDGQPAAFVRVKWSILIDGKEYVEYVTSNQHGYYPSLVLPKCHYTLSISDDQYLFPTLRNRPPGLSVADFYKGEQLVQQSKKLAPSIIIPVDQKVQAASKDNKRPLFVLGLLLARLSKFLWAVSLLFNLWLLVVGFNWWVVIASLILLSPFFSAIKAAFTARTVDGQIVTQGVNGRDILVRWYSQSGEPVGIAQVDKNKEFSITTEDGAYFALALPKNMQTSQQPFYFTVPDTKEIKLEV